MEDGLLQLHLNAAPHFATLDTPSRILLVFGWGQEYECVCGGAQGDGLLHLSMNAALCPCQHWPDPKPVHLGPRDVSSTRRRMRWAASKLMPNPKFVNLGPRNVKQYPEAHEVDGLLLLRIDAALYFANVNPVRDALHKYEQRAIRESERRGVPIRFIAIDLSPVTDIDASAVHFLAVRLQQRVVLHFNVCSVLGICARQHVHVLKQQSGCICQ